MQLRLSQCFILCNAFKKKTKIRIKLFTGEEEASSPAVSSKTTLWVLEHADDLGHVTSAFAKEGVKVGARITKVRTPAGAVEHIVVAGSLSFPPNATASSGRING